MSYNRPYLRKHLAGECGKLIFKLVISGYEVQVVTMTLNTGDEGCNYCLNIMRYDSQKSHLG